MREYPIPFNSEMVRALRDGRKTQTRRVIRPQPEAYSSFHRFLKSIRWKSVINCGEDSARVHLRAYCPYGKPGDRLWVRESLRRCIDSKGGIPLALYDAGRDPVLEGNLPVAWMWKNSVLTGRYMPRWASRITLEITGVRVERVQDIDNHNAWQEGIPLYEHWPVGIKCYNTVRIAAGCGPEARDMFAHLWDTINAKRGYSWDTNPWVWVVSFKVLSD